MKATEPSPPPVSPAQSPMGGEAAHRERRALRWGVGISVGVHLLLLAAYPLLMGRLDPEVDRPRPDEETWTVPAMEVVRLRDVLDPDPADPDPAPVPEEVEPEEPEEPDEPEPEPDDPSTPPEIVDLPPEIVAPPAEEPEAERRSIAERLQPMPSDPRLWLGLEEYVELTDAERAELLLHGMIRNWNDSMAVAAALREEGLDWTYTDDEGRRWGLSPGRLHLGDYSIPLPFSFDSPRVLGPDGITRDWIHADIERGAWSAELREIWAERAREIRRRMDEERDRRRGGGGGGD